MLDSVLSISNIYYSLITSYSDYLLLDNNYKSTDIEDYEIIMSEDKDINSSLSFYNNFIINYNNSSSYCYVEKSIDETNTECGLFLFNRYKQTISSIGIAYYGVQNGIYYVGNNLDYVLNIRSSKFGTVLFTDTKTYIAGDELRSVLLFDIPNEYRNCEYFDIHLIENNKKYVPSIGQFYINDNEQTFLEWSSSSVQLDLAIPTGFFVNELVSELDNKFITQEQLTDYLKTWTSFETLNTDSLYLANTYIRYSIASDWINDNLSDVVLATVSDIRNNFYLKHEITTVLSGVKRIMGSVDSYDDLPTDGMENGYCYIVGSSDLDNKEEWIWIYSGEEGSVGCWELYGKSTQELTDDINTNKLAILDNKNNIEIINNSLSNIQTDINNNTSNISTINTSITDIQSDIEALETCCTNNSSSIINIDTSIKNLMEVKQNIDSEDLNTTDKTIVGAINELVLKIESIEDDIDNLNLKMDNVNSIIVSLQDYIDKKIEDVYTYIEENKVVEPEFVDGIYKSTGYADYEIFLSGSDSLATTRRDNFYNNFIIGYNQTSKTKLVSALNSSSADSTSSGLFITNSYSQAIQSISMAFHGTGEDWEDTDGSYSYTLTLDVKSVKFGSPIWSQTYTITQDVTPLRTVFKWNIPSSYQKSAFFVLWCKEISGSTGYEQIGSPDIGQFYINDNSSVFETV